MDRGAKGSHRKSKGAAAGTTVDEPWRSLRSAYHAWRQRSTAVLAGFGLSVSEYVVLELCFRAPAKASEVARAVAVTPAGATDVIDRLQFRRLVRRVEDPDDRRAVLVRLTPLGRRRYREAKTAVRRLLDLLTESMTTEERRALAVGVAAMLRALPEGPA